MSATEPVSVAPEAALARPRRMPSRPRCALEVAVVGNRRFTAEGETETASTPGADRMWAHAASGCTSIWRALGEELLASRELELPLPGHTGPGAMPRKLAEFFSEETPRLGVLSCLAAGGDQVAARTALDAFAVNRSVIVELEAILPFPETDYPGLPGMPCPDFRADEAQHLRDLAARARQVLRMDGHRRVKTDEPETTPINHEARVHAYRQGRDVLLHNADLLLAVVDPLAPGAAGGSLETIGIALDQGMPVIAVFVRPEGARVAFLRVPADLRPNRTAAWAEAWSLDDPAWVGAARELVRYLIALPHMTSAAGETDKEREERLHELAAAVAGLDDFFDPQLVAHRCGTNSQKLYGRVWTGLQRLSGWFADRPDRSGPPPRRPARDEVTIQPFKAYYAWASEVSGAFMRTYRGSFVLTFALSSVAVGIAVGSLSAGLWLHETPAPWLVVTLGFLKILCLCLMLVLAGLNRKHRHQEQAADFRYMAELLRPMEHLAPFAISIPRVDLPPYYVAGDPRQHWTEWLFRAVCRAHPSVSVAGDEPHPKLVEFRPEHAEAALTRAREEWLQGQIHYHWSNAESMHRLESGLERIAGGLIWAVIVFVIFAVFLELLEPRLGETVHFLAVVFGALAAALPAAIAAAAGILFQSEAKRLRLRSGAMYRGLVLQSEALAKLQDSLGTIERETGCTCWHSALALRRLAGQMLKETGDWRFLYPVHGVKAA
jgi:hypothetical protein